MKFFDNFLKKKSLKFKKLSCHPKNYTHKKYSCFDKQILKKMKNIWNKRYPDNKINSNNENIIWNELKKNLSNTCSNELCWINNLIYNKKIKNKLKKNIFAPTMPHIWKKNKNEWLNSNDILNVMNQYEKAYNEFDFFGPSPIDYNTIIYNQKCVWPEICNINIKKLYDKGKYKLGLIFNTDKHFQEGSHWIALFIDLKKKYIFFFDSNGNKKPQEITNLIENIYSQCENNINIKMKIDSNENFIHQQYNTECGMYCLYFLISLITKKHNYKYFKEKKIKDKYVENLRQIYYNNI